MSFIQSSIDFFLGEQTSHMGPYQYAEHQGKRGTKSMSGAKLWAEIEKNESLSSDKNLVSADEQQMINVARSINTHLPEELPVLEMGPGTPSAFRKKMLRLLMALRSINYICVDSSQALLDGIVNDKALALFNVSPILDNFFEEGPSYFDDNEQHALLCLLGGTIGNIIAPLSDSHPTNELSQNLRTLSQKINKGWLLISYDANDDGTGLKKYYNHHIDFHLNIFDRMAVELPITGDFDPCAFEYEPMWIPTSGQLAHMAVVNRDMSFTIGEQAISLSKGKKLHLKNSFKFTRSFFETCCQNAELEVAKTWGSASLTNVALLRKKA